MEPEQEPFEEEASLDTTLFRFNDYLALNDGLLPSSMGQWPVLWVFLS